MTVSELIRELLKLPQDSEIAVNGAQARATSPEIVSVNQWAFSSGDTFGGFRSPSSAFLLRPAREVI